MPTLVAILFVFFATQAVAQSRQPQPPQPPPPLPPPGVYISPYDLHWTRPNIDRRYFKREPQIAPPMEPPPPLAPMTPRVE